jgi:toxin ParE1/3/4
VVERIIQGVERLASLPESGRVVPERSDPQLREVIVRPYRVVYRIRPGAVEIATVFRASRMLPEMK